MGATRLLVVFAAAILTGCMDDNDWQGIHDSLGSSHMQNASVYQDPFPYSENEEAAMGPKAYDTQMRQLSAQNER